MKIGGTARGMFAGFLGLVALHAVGSRGGSGRVAEGFADVAGLIERLLDPNVAGLPDFASAAGAARSRAAGNTAAADLFPLNPAAAAAADGAPPTRTDWQTNSPFAFPLPPVPTR